MGRLHYRPSAQTQKTLVFSDLPDRRMRLEIEKDLRDFWRVRWIIKHHGRDHIDGKYILDTEEMRAAFDLGETTIPKIHTAADFARRYGADVGVSGKFIRKGVYLNIPCPGTGCEGDPNMSIKLTSYIQRPIECCLDAGMVSR